MILIEDILVSEEVVQKHFACNLNACKGACCVEGDYGAPLSKDEVLQLTDILPKVLPYLPKASQEMIQDQGFHSLNDSEERYETALMADGACVFMGRDELNITFCGIEKAYNDGVIEFKKPISCHLYPIRVSQNKLTGFQALNYDSWDICNPACRKGNKEEIKVFEFVKEAIIRKYGEDFFEALEAAAEEYKKKEKLNS